MKVVIVGCTHAGIAAIQQVLTYYPEAEITVYERHDNISYLSCATYLHIEGTVNNLSDAFYAEPDKFVEQGVDMKLNHDVIRIDGQARTLLVQDLMTKEMTEETFDKLIMATGSSTAIPSITGIENPNVMLCKTYDQAHDLCAVNDDRNRIAIIGGGYVGVELVEGYVNSGHEVILIQRHEHLLNNYVEPKLSLAMEEVLRAKGVKVLTDTNITAFEDTTDGQLKIKTDHDDYEVDMAVICAGIIPQTDLLSGQVEMMANGAIITDDYMQTSNPDIFAAGDASVIHYNPTHSTGYAPLASHAIRQGALAGINVFDKRVRSIGTQATTGMLIFGYTVACTGLTVAAANTAAFDVGSVVYEGSYRPGFMPEAHPVTIELIYDRNSRKVLGAQIMSQHEVSQSANTMSVFIQHGGTIDELAMIDMLFSPNFNQPFDYLNQVGQLAVEQEHGYLRT